MMVFVPADAVTVLGPSLMVPVEVCRMSSVNEGGYRGT
jgi:hypothetical protein